ADGEYILVANEGEWNETARTMGSASVITIGASTNLGSISSLNQSAAVTVDFSAANLADGVSIEGLRVSDPSEGLPYGIEPEYVSYADGKVYCSLQEASAIGVLDIASGKWVDIIRMPYMFQTIDASNKDDGAIIDDSVVLGMPMPDTIDTFVHDGKTYIVTANEGDFNPEDTDKASVKDLGTEGLPALEAAYLANLNALYDGNALATSALGNLNVSIIDGLNSAEEITQLHVPGTRSFSVIDAESGSVVWDSGNDFETITALIDIDGYADKRSDDKGPEPEGLCVFEMASERYVALLMERTYAAFLYNIRDPLNPRFVDYFRADVGESEPECVRFLSASQSPSDRPMLVIGYEDSKTVCLVDIETWMGYPRNAAKPNVDTQGWMGRVYVDGNWAYIWGLNTWIYIEESYMGEVGGWAYMFR
ncbi:MAG: hypothetical protein JW942_00435, partial [Opitutales bacterium]|nr:hypothetical protein [Opitutales bacterium]